MEAKRESYLMRDNGREKSDLICKNKLWRQNYRIKDVFWAKYGDCAGIGCGRAVWRPTRGYVTCSAGRQMSCHTNENNDRMVPRTGRISTLNVAKRKLCNNRVSEVPRKDDAQAWKNSWGDARICVATMKHVNNKATSEHAGRREGKESVQTIADKIWMYAGFNRIPTNFNLQFRWKCKWARHGLSLIRFAYLGVCVYQRREYM